MALAAAEQVAQDLAEFLAHDELHHSEWMPVVPTPDGLAWEELVAGYEVLPHVQSFADKVRPATGVKSIGTYPGHSPSLDRALDLFTPVNSTALGNAITDYAIAHQERFGVRYVIYRRHIWHRLDQRWVLMEDRGSLTQNHYDHVHVSFELTAAEKPDPPMPDPEPEDEMAKAALGVYDYAGQTYITDGMFRRPTNDPFVYLNAGLAEHLGAFTDGQHGELVERADLLVDDTNPGGVDLTAIADRVAAKVADAIAERLRD